MNQAKFLATPAHESADLSLSPELQEAFGSLNVGQIESAVVAIYGAPGVGKTSQLRALFEHTVKLGSPVSAHLVFAATRDAAATLRKDLALDLQSTYEGSLARTISSFAYAIVRHSALALGERSPELISGSEQDNILAHLVSGLVDGSQKISAAWPNHFDSKVFALNGFRTELRDLIAACQEHGLNSEMLAKLGAEQKRGEWVAASELFAEYEQLLATSEYKNRFDAPTLIAKATDLVRAGEVDALLANYKTIWLDDAQELTPSAARFLEAIAKGRGLIMFGDPDSSTLGFRAADPKIFTDLGQKLGGSGFAKLHLLEAGFDRPNSIRKVLAKAASKIDGAGSVEQRKANLFAGEVSDSALETVVLKSAETEVAWLARRLREAHLHHKLDWQDMAVVARSRSQLEALELALAAESVPVRIVGAQAALRDEFGSRQLLEIASLAFETEPLNIEQVVSLLTSAFSGLDNLSMRRLRRQLRAESIASGNETNSNALLVEIFKNGNSLDAIEKSHETKLARRFLKRFEATRKLAQTPGSSIEDILWQIWDDSEPLKRWSESSRGVGEVAVQANRNLDSVLELFAAANRYVERDPGAPAYEFVKNQLEAQVPEDSLAIGTRGRKTVDLLTPSGLIGRRYELVAIPQLIEGVFPNLSPRSSLLAANVLSALMFGRISDASQAVRTEFADEMRMLYKAVGASNNRVLMSAAEAEEAQLSQFLQLAAGKLPDAIDYEISAFTLRGMAGSERRRLAVTKDPQVQAASAAALAELAVAQVPGAHPDSWYGLLQISTDEPLFDLAVTVTDGETTVDKIKLSPSQIEKFVQCPLHWFITTHGGETSNFSANLGSLIHKALELNLNSTEAELRDVVNSKWHTLEFESAWQEQAERRNAESMITNLMTYLNAFGGEVAAREQTFGFELGNVKISGKVDRIELTPEGRVMIVDLKTGKYPPSAEKTQDHAQLGVYQLAFANGAFEEVETLKGKDLEGAKLLFVGGKKYLKPRDQGSIEQPGRREFFENLILQTANEMAMPNKVYIANVAEHCDNPNAFGKCSIHLVEAVSYDK